MAHGASALNQPPDEIPPRVTIGEVCRLTGLRPGTLRNWEERYGLLEPARTPGGTRLYSQADVRRIQEIQRLLKANGNSLLAVSRSLAGERLTAELRTGQRRTGDRRRAPNTMASLERLFALAGRAEVAIENARLLEAHVEALQLRQRVAEFEAQIAQTAAASLDLDTVLQGICTQTAQAMGVDRVSIWLSGDEAGLVRAAEAGIPAPSALKRTTAVMRSLAEAAPTGKGLLLSKAYGTIAASDQEIADDGVADAILVPFGTAGRTTGILTLTDVHQLKQFSPKDIEMAEAVARQAALAIANTLAYRNQQEAIRRLDELNRMKSSFLSTMRHELRTPLNAILGFSDLLHSHAAGDLTPKQERYVNNIRQGGRNLLHLVDDILEYSVVQSRETLERELVAVKPLLEEVAATYQAEAESRNITLQVEAGQLPTITGDRLRLGRAVRQLIDNAVKFTAEGGHVTVTATQAEGAIVIAVRDTGAGIGLDDQQRIFEPFVQVDGSDSRHHNGSGLGLAITQRIVALHSGSIRVQSVPGQGSTFTVHLPISSPATVPKGGNP